MPAHRVFKATDAVVVWLQADDEIGRIGQWTGHCPDAGPDFEHPLADVRAKQVEEMRAIASRLLHRLEIVGGVALLGLRVASIDVIGVRHVFWHATIAFTQAQGHPSDRKSTRLNSSHSQISYAVFCLKK